MVKNKIKTLLRLLAFSAATIAASSAQAQVAGGYSSSVAVPLTGTTVSDVCAEAEKAARTKATLACAPKEAKIGLCYTTSSGAGPAFPPPLFYYWCHVNCGYTCVDKPKDADATADAKKASDALQNSLIEYFERTQAQSELESLLYQEGQVQDLDAINLE